MAWVWARKQWTMGGGDWCVLWSMGLWRLRHDKNFHLELYEQGVKILAKSLLLKGGGGSTLSWNGIICQRVFISPPQLCHFCPCLVCLFPWWVDQLPNKTLSNRIMLLLLFLLLFKEIFGIQNILRYKNVDRGVSFLSSFLPIYFPLNAFFSINKSKDSSKN